MLVIDRREDESAYAPGANRAKVQAKLESLGFNSGPWESTAIPAQVEIEHPVEIDSAAPGVSCVTNTPGPNALLHLLLHRVWGVGKEEA